MSASSWLDLHVDKDMRLQHETPPSATNSTKPLALQFASEEKVENTVNTPDINECGMWFRLLRRE